MKTLLFGLLISLISLSLQAQKKPKPASPYDKLEQGEKNADGKRVGKWDFYNYQQELELTFDYDSSRVSFTKEDTTRYWVRADEQWQLKRIARAPHVLGSMEKRIVDLQRTLRYPVKALAQNQQGMVVLAYTVTPEGHTADYTIESSVSPECDQEVFRRLQALPDMWIPAVHRGRPTATRFYLFVRFKIAEGEEAKKLIAEMEARKKNPDAVAKPQPLLVTRTPYAHEMTITAVVTDAPQRIWK